jgi:arylsulfatase A-like enzyme
MHFHKLPSETGDPMQTETGRRNFLKTTALATGALTLSGMARALAASAAASKPNILFILADQWRGNATGYAGDPNVKTPNLDKLAGEALNFCNTVSVCPICTPYRAALLTGRFPTSIGMFLNDAYLPSEELCMAEILQTAGYTTGYIGKWHLDGHGRDAFIPPERRQGWEYWKVAECCHDYNNSFYYSGNDPQKKFWEGYDVFAQTKDAQNYLKERASGGQPFALVISYGTPHFPHATAPEEYKNLYPPEGIKLLPNVPESLQAAARKESQGYYAHCTALDQCVGDLLATLDKTGLTRNTIVVFTSDHGETMGSHGNKPMQKQVPWDESARVPFLLRFPAGQGGQGVTVKTPLTTPDILPTLLGLVNVPVPSSVEGEDLSAVVRNPSAPADRAALYMGIAPFASLGAKAQDNNREYRAIRTGRYTYVRDLKGAWLMYDDEKDPYQMNNLAGKPEYASLQKELDGKLQAELKKRGDEFRDGQYYIDLWGYKVINGNYIPYKSGSLVQSPGKTVH